MKRSNNTARKLDELLQRNKLTPAEAARLSGLSQAYWSRWLSGAFSIRHESWEAICGTVFRKDGDRAELWKARLDDLRVGPGADLVAVMILTKAAAAAEKPEDDLAASIRKLAPRAQKAIGKIVARLPNDPRLEQVVRALGEFGGKEGGKL